MSRLRLAVVSTFYPNSSAPYRTLFVHHLVTALARHAEVTVISPIPYAPAWPERARWRALRRVPRMESTGSQCVEHPRYLVIPGVPAVSGGTYALAIAPALRRAILSTGIDVIHAHCAYPDAVGVALVARWFGVPFVVTAHGSDVNVEAARSDVRRQVRWALSRAQAVIAVSQDLRKKISAMAPGLEGRLRWIPCSGVNPDVFHLGEPADARVDLGLERRSRVALFVGNLVPIKGSDVLLAAWRLLLDDGLVGSDDRLVFIGDGPLRSTLDHAARSPEAKGTIRITGQLPQERIARWMQAADVLCVSSHHEGMPNVVVEALASGLPVVATAVGGIPDLVSPEVNGYLAASGDPRQLADALARALDRKWDARQIAATVTDYNWENLAARNLDVLLQAALLRPTS